MVWAWLIWLGVSTSLLDLPRPHRHKPMRHAPLSWSSAPWFLYSDRGGYCDVVFFAVTGGGRLMRLRANSREMGVDTAWAIEQRIPEHWAWRETLEYLAPQTGERIACHEVQATCVPESDHSVTHLMRGKEGC